VKRNKDESLHKASQSFPLDKKHKVASAKNIQIEYAHIF